MLVAAGVDRLANEAESCRYCGARVWYYDGEEREYDDGVRECGDEERELYGEGKWRCVGCAQL